MPGLKLTPLTMEERNYLVVQLALLSRENAGALAAPNASNDPGPNKKLVAALLKLLERRAGAANQLSGAVASCTNSTAERPFTAPLNLTTIHVCIQQAVSRDFGAPRGILVVRFMFGVP